jgi:hypothetical protein
MHRLRVLIQRGSYSLFLEILIWNELEKQWRQITRLPVQDKSYAIALINMLKAFGHYEVTEEWSIE